MNDNIRFVSKGRKFGHRNFTDAGKLMKIRNDPGNTTDRPSPSIFSVCRC